MADVIVIGGGMGGLSTALLLAGDGHRVRLLERDPPRPRPRRTPPGRAGTAGASASSGCCTRSSPGWREVVEAELPEVAAAIDARRRRCAELDRTTPPPALDRRRPAGRRALRAAHRPPAGGRGRDVPDGDGVDGLTIERGVAVPAWWPRDRPDACPASPTSPASPPRTAAGCGPTWWSTPAAAGRPSPRWLADIGARPAGEEREDSGFATTAATSGRATGRSRRCSGPPLQPYDSLSTGDAVHRQRDVGRRHRDQRPGRHAAGVPRPEVWSRARQALPAGGPLAGGRADLRRRRHGRHRGPPPAVTSSTGAPVATGSWRVGDAWACTNPSVGAGRVPRRCSMPGACGTRCGRSPADERGGPGPTGGTEATLDTVEPIFRDTLTYDRHRLAEIDAAGRRQALRDRRPGLVPGRGPPPGAACDPDLLRAYAGIRALTARPPRSTCGPPGIREGRGGRGRRPPAAAGPHPRPSSSPSPRPDQGRSCDVGHARQRPLPESWRGPSGCASIAPCCAAPGRRHRQREGTDTCRIPSCPTTGSTQSRRCATRPPSRRPP